MVWSEIQGALVAVKVVRSSRPALGGKKILKQLSSLYGHVRMAGEIHCYLWVCLPLIHLGEKKSVSVTCKLLHKLVSRGTQQGSVFGAELLPSLCNCITAVCEKALTALTPGSSDLSHVSIYPKRFAEIAVFSFLPWKVLAVASGQHCS